MAEPASALMDFAARLETSEDLRLEIVRDIGVHTVALLIVSDAEQVALGGTGTLVSFLNHRYILTAAHVWKQRLRDSHRIGLTLREDFEHRYILDPRELVPFAPNAPRRWDKWGPDIALLRMPPERAAEMEARGRVAFYNLSIPRQLFPARVCVLNRILMGTPNVLARFAGGQGDLIVNGSFCDPDVGPFLPLDTPANIRTDFDYIDLEIDTTQGAPADFRGVSGGGIWRVVHYSPEGETIERLKILDGVAFHQEVIAEGKLMIRGHGPQSIGETIRRLFE
jgi:hypothetical protein